MTAERSKASRGLLIVILFFCLLGLAVAIELTRIHLHVHTDPSYHSVCAVSEGVNCETVAASPYSVFAGLPVSVWGILGYLVIGLLALWSLTRWRLKPTWAWGLLASLSGFAVCTSAVLGFISVTRIDSLCLFCMGSYGINIVLLVMTVLLVRRAESGFITLLRDDAKQLLARPLVTVALLVVGLISFGALQLLIVPYWKTPGWSDLPQLAAGMDDDGHHWLGAPDPVLEIAEFSDYECPHCRAAHKEIRLLAAKHPRKVRLIHRHLPLDQSCNSALSRPFHTRACSFAEAAECAALQGRFWDMNDALFSIQETEKTENVDPMHIAVRLGLDRQEFKACLEQHLALKRVERDIVDANAKRLRGTPSFIIDGKVYVGRIPAAELEQLLEAKTKRTIGLNKESVGDGDRRPN